MVAPDENSARASIQVDVASVERLGGDSYLYAKSVDGRDVAIHCRGQTRLQAGERIALHIDPGQLHLFDRRTGENVRPIAAR